MQQSRIEGEINAKHVEIGRGVVVEPGVVITGKHGPAESVILGDYCYIGRDTRIIVPEFRLGHYSKLNAMSFCHGTLPMQIGRNCWIGGQVVLDSIGGLDIDDGVGIGAQSQIWTHIQFGDIVEGCRFYGGKYMHIQRDAWFVGSCLVSPVEVGERAMALLGSVVTRDMQPNHVYGGSPAVDLTEKIGPQFEARTIDEKADKLRTLIGSFAWEHPECLEQLVVVCDASEIVDDERTYFDVSTRTYTRTHSAAEVAFLKAWTPLVKFTAVGEDSFIKLQNTLQIDEAFA